MVFGYSTNAFVKYSLREAIEKIAASGFKGFEIMCDRPHLYPEDFDGAEVASLRERIAELGCRITNLNCFTLFAVGDTYLPSWIEPDEERRAIRVRHTLNCLKLADAIGCGCISVPPGGPLDGMGRKEATALFREGLEQVLPMAENLGVKVLIEPEPELFLENTAEFKAFIAEIASPAAGLNFDIGHFYCVGEDPAEAFEELREWVGHVHLEDIAASRAHEHLIAGRGAIDFHRVFKAMADTGYDGDICLELYPYIDSPVEAGVESLEYLKPIFREAGLSV